MRAGVQAAAKDTEKVAAFFRTYSDASSDLIGPEGRTTNCTREPSSLTVLQPRCCI